LLVAAVNVGAVPPSAHLIVVNQATVPVAEAFCFNLSINFCPAVTFERAIVLSPEFILWWNVEACERFRVRVSPGEDPAPDCMADLTPEVSIIPTLIPLVVVAPLSVMLSSV
jgi:hypothetical protein